VLFYFQNNTIGNAEGGVFLMKELNQEIVSEGGFSAAVGLGIAKAFGEPPALW
jgi:hypothetical protein